MNSKPINIDLSRVWDMCETPLDRIILRMRLERLKKMSKSAAK